MVFWNCLFRFIIYSVFSELISVVLSFLKLLILFFVWGCLDVINSGYISMKSESDGWGKKISDIINCMYKEIFDEF